LHLAAEKNNMIVMELLILKGANPDARNKVFKFCNYIIPIPTLGYTSVYRYLSINYSTDYKTLTFHDIPTIDPFCCSQNIPIVDP